MRNVNKLSLDQLKKDFHYDLSEIETIGVHQSFPWVRPDHMKPTGKKTEVEIKDELVTQLNRCLNHLSILKNGEGLRYQTTMTVNDLGKLNVYEYIYFLCKHTERHLTQMDKNLQMFHFANVTN